MPFCSLLLLLLSFSNDEHSVRVTISSSETSLPPSATQLILWQYSHLGRSFSWQTSASPKCCEFTADWKMGEEALGGSIFHCFLILLKMIYSCSRAMTNHILPVLPPPPRQTQLNVEFRQISLWLIVIGSIQAFVQNVQYWVRLIIDTQCSCTGQPASSGIVHGDFGPRTRAMRWNIMCTCLIATREPVSSAHPARGSIFMLVIWF